MPAEVQPGGVQQGQVQRWSYVDILRLGSEDAVEQRLSARRLRLCLIPRRLVIVHPVALHLWQQGGHQQGAFVGTQPCLCSGERCVFVLLRHWQGLYTRAQLFDSLVEGK